MPLQQLWLLQFFSATVLLGDIRRQGADEELVLLGTFPTDRKATLHLKATHFVSQATTAISSGVAAFGLYLFLSKFKVLSESGPSAQNRVSSFQLRKQSNHRGLTVDKGILLDPGGPTNSHSH